MKKKRVNSPDTTAAGNTSGNFTTGTSADISTIFQQSKDNDQVASFNTLSTEDEITCLKKGVLPPEVIYTGEAGEKLYNIDKKITHLYSLLVNHGIPQMIISHQPEFDYYAPKLRKCLGETETWLDIGTGNGLVSNMVAFTISSSAQQAKLRNIISKLEGGDLSGLDTGALKFISCDLSKASLSLAEGLAHDSFHDLEKFFTLEYYPDTFQKFLQLDDGSKKPRLITMFNLLANCKYDELKATLTQMFDAMHEGDVFIPTFFHIEKGYEKSFHYNTYGLGGFRNLSRALYDNPETRDRCISAFCERYKVPTSEAMFNVTWQDDGRDFIDVNIFVPSETQLHVPQDRGNDIILKASECSVEEVYPGLTKFNVFPSYRMSKQQITDLCTAVGFKIDYRMECRNGLQIAPVLYKESK